MVHTYRQHVSADAFEPESNSGDSTEAISVESANKSKAPLPHHIQHVASIVPAIDRLAHSGFPVVVAA